MSRIDGVDVLDRGGRLEQSPDAAGEVALEAADRFAGALAFATPAIDVVARRRVTACAGDDHAVQRRVDLAVSASVEPLALGVSRAGGDPCDARRAGEPGRCAKALGAGGLAGELGGDQRPESRLAEQLRCDLPDERADLALELVDRLRELAQSAQLITRDANARRLLRAGEPPADPRSPLLREQRAAR